MIRFPRIEDAIRFTLEYFSQSRIKDYTEKFEEEAKGNKYHNYLDNWEELIYSLHSSMEEEIQQNILGSNTNIQAEMFGLLKDWLTKDSRISLNFKKEIERIVAEYNESAWERYARDVEEDEQKYRLTVDYNRGHLEGYQREIKGRFALGMYFPPKTENVTNSWFYTNERKADLINEDYLYEYYLLVERLIINFQKVGLKYLNRYEEGHTASGSDIVTKRQNLLPPFGSFQELTDSAPIPNKKLKFDLSVPRLLILFIALKERGIINVQANADLVRFIKANFSSKASEDISEKSMANQFSELDNSAIDFWLEELKQLKIVLANLKK